MERYLIEFTKLNEAKFISHLDTMRTIHRAFRRAELPISYSKGFNPHPSISVAAPLSLGISSLAEYADVEMDMPVDENDIIERLNNNLPSGINVKAAMHIEEKMPTSMSAVDGAEYLIKIKLSDGEVNIGEIINKILGMQEINIMKRTKSGEKLTDIRKMIKSIVFSSLENGCANIICRIDTGSKSSLSPEYAADILRDYSEGRLYGYADITRLEIFTEKNSKWVVLGSYFTGK